MPPVNAYLHHQLMAQRFWETPQPLLPIRRVQQCLGLRDGGEVADWLRAQGAMLAWDRLARWLTALARAEEAGYTAACHPAARAFRERALAHLWDHLEDAFEGQVYPLLDAARRWADPGSARLRAAAATSLSILTDASLLPGAPGGDWRALFRDRWPDRARDADVLAELMAAWSAQLFRLLTERLPTYPAEARWQMAHAAADLARALAAVLEAGWERFKGRGLFTAPNGGVGHDLWVYVTFDSAEEFFYGGTDDFPELCYLPVQVRELFPDGTASEAKSLAQLIASSADGVQALLLGRAGAGKSTELLKLCLDCCAPSSSSPLWGEYAPMLLDLKGKFDRRGQGSYEEFLRRLRDDLELTEELSDEELEEELRYTPQLLVMLDGLDDVEPEGIAARDAIADMLVRFMSTLHPTSCVLLACREQERQRHHESLLRSLEGWPGLLRTLRIDDLALDGAQLRGYLGRLLRQDTLVEALLAAFEVHPDLRRTPRLLSACISLARLYSAGEPLAPDCLYRAVVETCLEEEIHVRGKPRLAGLTPSAGVSFVQMAMGFVDVLTSWTVPQHSRTLSPAAAQEILAAFLARCLAPGGRLPAWWPLTVDCQRRLGVDGERVHEEELEVINPCTARIMPVGMTRAGPHIDVP
ncbi:MAG TPA: hypothetical protein VNP04_07410 [Alphaproteobacteria bacterium]|nr:hypothetical protein [Alphaproteobacteria bacterium]